MKVTWKNLPVLLTICGVILSYVLRFEVLASNVDANKKKVVISEQKIDVIFKLMCEDSINKAKTKKDKKEAIKRCTIKKEKDS